MNTEQDRQSRLRRLLWDNTARQTRPHVAERLAKVLACEPDDLAFADYERSNHVDKLFSAGLESAPAVEIPHRSAALELLRQTFSGIDCAVAYLPNECDKCGVLTLSLQQILAHMDELVNSEREALRFVSWDGKIGACVTVEEGTAPHYPRYVHIWK